MRSSPSLMNYVGDVDTDFSSTSLGLQYQTCSFATSEPPATESSVAPTHTNRTSCQVIDNRGTNDNEEATPFIMRPATIWTYVFATLAAASSDRGPLECAVASGSYGQIAYRYFAHAKDCAKMSQKGNIERALHQEFDRLEEDEIPSSNCIRFDEGGSWEGWLLFGRLGEVDLAQYCGPRIGFGKSNSRSEL